MQGLANKWKAMIQSQSAEQMKFSRLTAGRNEEKPKNKESIGLLSEEPSKHPKQKEGREKDKNNNSRTRSNQQQKGSSSKYVESSGFQAETPIKIFNKKQDKLVQKYTNSIVDLLEEEQGKGQRGKVRALLQDLTANVGLENNMSSSVRVSVGDRAYHDLEQRYLQSEKQRQYLKGKMEISSKRYQGLEREVQRYGKMEKMIDSSISRQSELRQEINRVKAEKAFLEAQMEQQNETFSQEVQSIKSLIESLKEHLPIN